MTTKFVRELRKTMKNEDIMKTDDEGEEKGGLFLVAFKNKLFQLSTDFSVIESKNGYESIGVGYLIALGSLNTTHKMNLTAKKRIEMAMDAACQLNAACSKPITSIKTKK